MAEETEVLEECDYQAPLYKEFQRYLAGFWHHAETPGQKAVALFVVIPLMILAMPFVLVLTGLFVVLAWVHGKYERIRSEDAVDRRGVGAPAQQIKRNDGSITPAV